jgi:hypothetical protein
VEKERVCIETQVAEHGRAWPSVRFGERGALLVGLPCRNEDLSLEDVEVVGLVEHDRDYDILRHARVDGYWRRLGQHARVVGGPKVVVEADVTSRGA